MYHRTLFPSVRLAREVAVWRRGRVVVSAGYTERKVLKESVPQRAVRGTAQRRTIARGSPGRGGGVGRTMEIRHLGPHVSGPVPISDANPGRTMSHRKAPCSISAGRLTPRNQGLRHGAERTGLGIAVFKKVSIKEYRCSPRATFLHLQSISTCILLSTTMPVASFVGSLLLLLGTAAAQGSPVRPRTPQLRPSSSVGLAVSIRWQGRDDGWLQYYDFDGIA